MSKRYPISVRAKVYTRLKELGRFGESFSDVLNEFSILYLIIKRWNSLIVTSSNHFSFTAKRCKSNEHSLCEGAWEGLKLLLYCDCPCHSSNETLGK